MDTTVSPVLTPPSDASMRRRLELKLAEYETRKSGAGKPWEISHPKVRFRYAGYRDAYYKAFVLKALLEAKESLKTFDLARTLQQMLQEDNEVFEEEVFNNACSVVNVYLSGSQMEFYITPGTGLPADPEEKAQ